MDGRMSSGDDCRTIRLFMTDTLDYGVMDRQVSEKHRLKTLTMHFCLYSPIPETLMQIFET